jgi:hypothetical protein
MCLLGSVVGYRSLEIREKALGKNHPRVATTLENMSGLYEKSDKQEEATSFEERTGKMHVQGKRGSRY